jgi:2,3-dihydroxybenzoate decarboxylase
MHSVKGATSFIYRSAGWCQRSRRSEQSIKGGGRDCTRSACNHGLEEHFGLSETVVTGLREPLPSGRQAYEGHPWLVASTWGFAAETSIHALRLMGSGLFDEYPKLKLILGHLGEGLPFSIWRVDHRISKTGVRPKATLPIGEYLRENFYITTSGNFRTQALTDVILEVGADRVLYSVDYPYEDMVEAAGWFERAAVSETDRLKIASSNARQLFHL